jgi:tetratricopeptide (TPR) repeat protein
MGLLNFFSGKDPEDYEKKGDALFETGAFGKAIVEYERALEKLEKSSPWDDGYRHNLRDKISSSKENLAQAHEKTARELIEAGHNEDARQYIELALELTGDSQQKATLEKHLQKLDTTKIEAIQTTLPNFDTPDQEDKPQVESIPHEQEDEHFTALIGTLPEEVQESYRGYPAAFRIGYVALNRGDFEQAAEYLSQAMQEIDDPQSYIPLELATAYLNLAKYDEATRLAESFLKHHPDVLPAYQLLCEIFWENKDFDRAETLLASLPEELSESVAGYLLRGETLYQAAKYAEAKVFYRDFLKNYEWHEAIARAQAKNHEALGEMANARYIYREIMDQCRSCRARIDPYIKQKFADLSFGSGLNTTEILELYLSLAQEVPQNAAEYYQKISRIYSAQGNRVEAQRFQLLSEKYEKKE